MFKELESLSFATFTIGRLKIVNLEVKKKNNIITIDMLIVQYPMQFNGFLRNVSDPYSAPPCRIMMAQLTQLGLYFMH